MFRHDDDCPPDGPELGDEVVFASGARGRVTGRWRNRFDGDLMLRVMLVATTGREVMEVTMRSDQVTSWSRPA